MMQNQLNTVLIETLRPLDNNHMIGAARDICTIAHEIPLLRTPVQSENNIEEKMRKGGL